MWYRSVSYTHLAEGDGEYADTDEEDENLDPDAGKTQQQVIDEITGQLNLFPDE